MANVIPVPSLSAAGWVTALGDKADILFSHFYLAEKAQTALYGSNVTSLPWIIASHSHDPVNLVNAVRDGLEGYLMRYYDSATVNVSIDDKNQETQGQFGLKIYATVVEEGKTYSFGKLLTVKNSKIERIINLINGIAN